MGRGLLFALACVIAIGLVTYAQQASSITSVEPAAVCQGDEEKPSAIDLIDVAWLNETDDLFHGGGLNACGCHFNRRTGQCHCHQQRGCGCSCQPAGC